MIVSGYLCNKKQGHHDFADCYRCGLCLRHCECEGTLFDADELGLDPETDNSPNTGSRHA